VKRIDENRQKEGLIGAKMSRRRFLGVAGLAAGGIMANACATLEGGGGSGKGGQISIIDDTTNPIIEKEIIPKFEKKTGIKVANYQQVNINELHDKLATMLSSSDDSFDVMVTWAAWSAEFGAAGWLQKLDEGDVPDDLVPGALDAVSWDGVVYGLPKFASVQTMFYNKTLFEEAGLDPEAPPRTWEDFVDAAARLTDQKRYGYAADFGNIDGAYQNFLRTLLLNGGEMYDDQQNPVFNSQEGVGALDRLVGLLREREVMDPSTMQISHSDDLSTLFIEGDTGIVFNWPFQYATATDPAKSTLTAETLGNAILPGIAVPSATIDGSEGFAISSYSKNKEPALEWLRFVASPEVQRRIVVDEGWLPVSKSLLDDEEVVQALPVVETYKEQSKYKALRYGAPWYSDVTTHLSTEITDAMLGRKSPQEALDAAASQAKKTINGYKGQ
jgi:multiple sugar transport system substrate-binding protein